MEFWRYYRVVRRRLWIVAATMLTAIVVAFAANRPAPGDYSATATLALPSTQQFAVVSGLAGAQGLGNGPDRTAQAVDLIRSRDVAERAIQEFNLDIQPGDLQRRLTVDRDPITGLIRVTVAGRNPGEAVTLANAVAQAAAQYDQEVERRGATLAREFIEKQAEGIQTNLREAEDALLAYQQHNGVALATSQNSRVASLEDAAQQVSLSLQETDARLGADRAQMTGQTATRSDPQLEENPVAQQLRAQLVQLEVALTSEEAIHTDKHPTVVALKAKIDAIKERLKSEVGRIVAAETIQHNPIYDAIVRDRINLETERVALSARQEAIQGALSTAARALPDYVQKEMDRGRLAREVDILGRQYASIQGQLGDARLREQEAQVLGSLSVVDLARGAVPSPFRGLEFKLTLALVMGLIGGVALVFFLEYLDDTLATPENAERVLGIPTLVAVPRHNRPFAEAYRRLRVNLTALENPDRAPVLALTGVRPGGGTSTVVANLARAFAQAGRRTVVVDMDFRRPTQHVHFGIPNETGLLQVLAGEAPPRDATVATDVPNLSVLPSGVMQGEAAGELVCSKPMRTLLTELKKRCDVILLDTPPAGAFPDVLAVAPWTTGVVLVLDARQAPRGIEQQVKLQLSRLGAKILGTVLTKVRPDLVDAYVYQTRYYHARTRRMRLSVPPALPATVGNLLVLIVAGMVAVSGFAGGVRVGGAEGLSPLASSQQAVHYVGEGIAQRARLFSGIQAGASQTVRSAVQHVTNAIAQGARPLPGLQAAASQTLRSAAHGVQQVGGTMAHRSAQFLSGVGAGASQTLRSTVHAVQYAGGASAHQWARLLSGVRAGAAAALQSATYGVQDVRDAIAEWARLLPGAQADASATLQSAVDAVQYLGDAIAQWVRLAPGWLGATR